MLQMPVDDVVDPHIHLFDLKGTPRQMQPLGKLFGWNERVLRFMATKLMPSEAIDFFGRKTDLLGDYLPEHFRGDSESSNVRRYVHIQAGWKDDKPLDPVGETAWLAGMADGPAAIVAHADLNLGADVAPVLAAHQQVSDKVRGVRHMISHHRSDSVMDFCHDPNMSRSATFREGFDQLAQHDLSFDAWCYGHQLDQISELAAYNPAVPMVLCHVGTPVGMLGQFGGVGVSAQERARIADEWRDAISALAQHQHVMCKLSGLLMPVLGLGYEDASRSPSVGELVDTLTPIIDHCVDAFGPDRCMVASNFPVDRVATSYAVMTEAMVEMTARFGQDAQQALFADTAARFYRI